MKIKTIYSLKDGSSKFEEMEIPFKEGDNSPNSIGQLTSLIPACGVYFRETPADYHFSWHVAPQRQFIINLDAAVEVTMSDGESNIVDSSNDNFESLF